MIPKRGPEFASMTYGISSMKAFWAVFRWLAGSGLGINLHGVYSINILKYGQ